MNDPAVLKTCPGCHKELEANWVVCPHCGLRLKPANDLLVRSLMWLAVLTAFTVLIAVIGTHDRDAASGLGFLFGLPLAYVFGKAVVFRLAGTPLTWNQLWNTSFRAGMMTFLMLVVVPMVLGVALLIFLFIACSGIMGGLGH